MVILVRQSSDTPNITNRDDTKMIRYAYGGYNGVVKDFGSQLSGSYEGGTFKIGSGRAVLQGWEVDLDEGGWQISVSGISGKQYYSVYLEINLITETAEIKSVYATGDYPNVSDGDDLTTQQSGTARMLLYNFMSDSGVIQNFTSKFRVIPYVNTQIESINLGIHEIEQRLDKLGFKSGQIDLSYLSDPLDKLDYTKNEIVKIGTNVYVNLYTITTIAATFNGQIAFSIGEIIATIPSAFIPSSDVVFWSPIVHNVSGSGRYYGRGEFVLRHSDGAIVFRNAYGTNVSTITSYDINFGYCLMPVSIYE